MRVLPPFRPSFIAYPDRIIARQHGGRTVLGNLALACLHCNRHQGPNIAGTDPETGALIRLFHPRVDLWGVHFEWLGAALSGRTGIGRVTVNVVAINEPDFLTVREALIEETFSLE
jgi:HNH endonuclease